MMRVLPSELLEVISLTPAIRPSERHLHCLWQDDRLRPGGLVTADGEPVRVLHPGRWNAGPGPDFTGTVIEAGSPARRLECDTEIHIDPAGWRQHGHLADPRYARVRLHVFIKQRDGRLQGAHVRQRVPDWQQASLWFCGPDALGQALLADFTAQGWPASRFHQELFAMR